MKTTASFADTENRVYDWANKVGIIKHGTIVGQLKKLYEEVDELRDAHISNNKAEIRDALADCMIVLCMISFMTGNDLRQCFFDAANEVTKRKGHMKADGIFYKDVL